MHPPQCISPQGGWRKSILATRAERWSDKIRIAGGGAQGSTATWDNNREKLLALSLSVPGRKNGWRGVGINVKALSILSHAAVVTSFLPASQVEGYVQVPES